MTYGAPELLAVLGLLVLAIVCTAALLRRVERRLQLLPDERNDYSVSTWSGTSSADPIDLLALREAMKKTVRIMPNAVRVRTSSWLATNKLYRAELEAGRQELVGHSDETISQLLRGVTWHEWPMNCPTWTGDALAGACRCDTEEGAA